MTPHHLNRPFAGTPTNPSAVEALASNQCDLPADAITEMVNRASGTDYRPWWRAVTGTGYCAHPIHLRRRHGQVAGDRLMLRCGNRRAAVCPPCSRLYAGDTWQLVHAGILGGHQGIPTTVAEHPMAFVTLTAPSYGRVHPDGPKAGQPVHPDRYDYAGHVLFTWWAPELWRRFTIRARRLLTKHLRDRGHNPNQVRLTFLKVTENQARLIPHFHAVLRLDPTEPRSASDPNTTSDGIGFSSPELASIALRAAAQIHLDVPDPTRPAGERTLSFGTQVDARPLDPTLSVAARKRIAGYLAKYVTKSVTDYGVSARRVSPQVARDDDVLAGLSEHTKAIIATLTALADTGTAGTEPADNIDHTADKDRGRYTDRDSDKGGDGTRAAIGSPYVAMLRWLHTLGYRGHVTTKSRNYSTTMGALRATRALWRRNQHSPADPRPGATPEPGDQHGDHDADAETPITAEWTYVRSGHDTRGDYHLTAAAARAHLEQLWARRDDHCTPPAESS
ncbi:replication initiator [Tsukamurella sp. DT100]|uniref:replication initiator n=1 Tax=Tsukamurella sp. DT100 TaxID=3393415 RepID=UPI003CEB9DF7